MTGTSCGDGRAAAHLFLDGGWNVSATMRQPKPNIFGPRDERLKSLPLDVTDSEKQEPRAVGVFEATPMATVREVAANRPDIGMGSQVRQLPAAPEGHRI